MSGWPITLGLGEGGCVSILQHGLEGGNVALPNPASTIVVMSPGWRGTFPVFTVEEDRIVTFDLSRLLAPACGAVSAERIIAVDEFGLSVIGPDGVTDTDPASRAQDAPTICGPMVSQRFGDWQADVGFIKYLVTAKMQTSRMPDIVVTAYLLVRKPPE